METVLFGELTSGEVARIARQRKRPVVILPMGALEAHGGHLPLWTDSATPYELAKRVAARTGALVLPPIEYGFCYTLRPWAGTVSLTSATFAAIIRDITRELVRNGFSRILFLNGHGADGTVAGHVLRELSDEFLGAPVHAREGVRSRGSCPDFRACVVSWWEMKELESELGASTGHADENEASLVMALTGWKKRASKPARQQRYFGRVMPMPRGAFAKYGYAGKAGGESSERGRRMERIIVEKLVKLVRADLLLKED